MVAKSRHGVMSRSMRSEASSLHASEPVVSLITWRPQAWERRLSLRVDSRSQRSRCFQRGDVCCTRQQTGEFCADPFLRYRQCGSCRQARALDAALLRLARHRERKVEGGKLRQQRLRASSARGGQEKALHRGLCGAARRGSDLRAGEKVRERAGVAGARVRRISRTGDARGSSSSRCP